MHQPLQGAKAMRPKTVDTSHFEKMPMKWAEDPGNRESRNHCACCGKSLKKAAAAHLVEVVDYGSSVLKPGQFYPVEARDYHGAYYVSAACARKYFPGFFSVG